LIKILGQPSAEGPRLASEALIAIKPDRGVVPDLIAVMKQNDPAYLRVGESAAAVFQAIGPEAIPDLIPILKDPDARLRSLALEALGAIGPGAEPAIPRVVAALKDGDAAVRAASARALGRIGPAAAPDGIGPLVTALGDREPAVAAATASALAGLGSEAKAARPALLARLGDPRQPAGAPRPPVGRRLLAESLLKIDPDARHDAVLALLGVLKSPDPGAWRDAVFTLAEAVVCLPEKDLVIPALVEVLGSPQQDLTWGAVALLKKLQAEEALLLIAQQWLRSSDPAPHLEALVILNALGPKARTAAPAVRELLKDRDLVIRSGAAGILLRFDPGAEDAQQVLLAVLEDRSAEPLQICMAVMPLYTFATPTRAAVPRFVNCLDESRHQSVRTIALKALGRSGPAASEVIPRMIKLLGDGDSSVRQAAAEALGGLGPLAKDAIPALKAITSGGDRDSDLRGIAADALRKIERPG
jgi:HEAT repeat protein